jgi:hypothetical protein
LGMASIATPTLSAEAPNQNMKKEPIKISLSMRIKPSTIQCQYRSSNPIVVLLFIVDTEKVIHDFFSMS